MDLAELTQKTLDDSNRWFGEGSTGSLAIMGLGLCGESGEVGDEIKKFLRGSQTFEEMQAKIAIELVDVLIYWTHLVRILGVDIDAAYEAKRAINEERFG